ncbi:MAG: hypothetical protein AAGD04_14510 [Pseudomonadota bacterium]
MKPDALSVVTMVYDDVEELTLWLRHWTKHLDQSQLWVITHGTELGVMDVLSTYSEINHHIHPRGEPYPTMEEDRWVFLSEFLGARLSQAEVVVYTDVDELLFTLPGDLTALPDRLMSAPGPVAFARGIELIHRQDFNPDPINISQPVFAQRPIYRRTSFHSKPSILRTPVKYGRGGHFVDQKGVRFAPGVYSVHFRFFDLDLLRARVARRRATTQASERHQAMRNRRWRHDDAALEAMIDEFHAWPVPSKPRLTTGPMDLRMRLTAKSKPNAEGLYRYKLLHGKKLFCLPDSFAEVL